MATLVVKLDAKTTQKDLDSMIKSFEKLDKSSQRAIKSASKSMMTLRKSTDMAVEGIKSLISSAGSISLSIAKDFYDTNVELEKFQVLMTGVTGSMDRGRAAMDYVLDFATKAPFSIDALSDTFVRFTVAGLKPMEGSMTSLTNAIAAFGGTPEDVKLATMALQQMSAKGVVSMEELRRQLSERVPTAIHDMAKGLGLSYAELVDKISSGNQMAGEAIEKLFDIWDEKYVGAAEKLMDTMKGAVTRTGVEWTRLMKDIGDGNGAFKSLTKVVNAAADALASFRSSAEGAKLIDQLSAKIVEIVEGFSDPEKIKSFFTAMVSGANTALIPLTKMYNFMLWMAASSDQIFGDLSKSNLKDVGVDTSKIDSSNYVEVRDTLLEIQSMYDSMSKRDITKLMLGDYSSVKDLQKELNTQLASGKIDIDTSKALIDMQRLVDKANDITLGIKVDTAPAKKAVDKMKEDIKRTPLELAGDETFAAMNKLKNAIGHISEEYSRLSESIIEKNEGIRQSQLDLATELRAISRGGLTEKSAWADLNSEIQDFISKAREAASAGDTVKQEDFLKRAKSLVDALPTTGIKMEVTEQSIASFKKILDYQQRITRGGKVEDGGKLNEYLAKYQKMQKALKEGEMEIVSGIEQRNKKYELTKQVGEELIKIRQKEVDILSQDRDKQTARFEEYKKAIEDAASKTELIKVAADEVGVTWIKVGESWMTTTTDMVRDNEKLIESIQNAITEMNTLQSMQQSNSTSTVKKASELGGRYKAGDTHLVGEKGRELFTSDKDGWIIPNHELNKPQSNNTVNLNLSIGGSAPVQLQGSPADVDALVRTLKENDIYSS